MMTRVCRSLLPGLVLFAVSASAQQIAYDLGPGSASEISFDRTVVGYSTRDGVQRAFIYSGGVMTTLGTLPGADFSIGYSINDRGELSGSSGGGVSPYARGFLYRSGVMTEIGTLGYNTYASAINNSGTIVGESASHAFSYSQGVMADLGTLGGRFSFASAINSSGVIVGAADLPVFTHAFRFSNGSMTDLGSLDGRMSYANDINDAGVIVGSSTIGGASSGYLHAFRYEGGTMTDLGTLVPAGYDGISEALGINSAGDIVGSSYAREGSSWVQHAFLYRDGVMTDLSPELAQFGINGSSWANDINDRGDIAGDWMDANGIRHGFVLFAPEPSMPGLFALGAVVLVCRRRGVGRAPQPSS